MISSKQPKTTHVKIDSSSQYNQAEAIKPIAKKQEESKILSQERIIDVVDKTDKSIVFKNSAVDYKSLKLITIEHQEFCAKQISAACSEQDLLGEQIKTIDVHFHEMYMDVFKQIGYDINFIFALQSHINVLFKILNSNGFDVKNLSDRCSLLVLELHEKIEYLKKAAYNVMSNSYQNASKDFLQALCITDANDMFKGEKCAHAVANIRVLLDMQKKYLPFIPIDCMDSSKVCYSLGYISLYQHENLRAVEYLKKGISLYPIDSEDCYSYLGIVHGLLKANKCDQKSDQDLSTFFNWVDENYNEYLRNNSSTSHT